MISAYLTNDLDESGCPVTNGTTNANICFTACLGLAILCQLFVKEDLRRQRAEKGQSDETSEKAENKYKEEKTSI